VGVWDETGMGRGGDEETGPALCGPARPTTQKPRRSGVSLSAAEWSRTITPLSGHKALKLTRHRTAKRKTAYRAKSIPAVSG